MHDFVHLHVHSSFSFLDGASSPRDLVARAADLGMEALAITDHDSVAAAVDFHRLAEEAGIRPIQGAELTVTSITPDASGAAAPAGAPHGGEEEFHLVVLAEDAAGYANLCRILTDAAAKSPRNSPRVTPAMLEGRTEGLIALSGCRRGEVPWRLLRGDGEGALRAAAAYRDIFGPDGFYLEIQADMLPGARGLARRMRDLGEHLGIGPAAANNVHYATKDRFPVHDVLTCVRLGIDVGQAHPRRRLNAENDLKPGRAMARIMADLPGGREALANTRRIAERCGPVLDLGASLHPSFPLPPGSSAPEQLRELVYRGARQRYGRVDGGLRGRLEHELSIIEKLGYADYFLLVWDVVRYARSHGIRCAGRGSAADSAVAYCLYITEVDAYGRGLLFERFMSLERAERPDIDIDFDWRYRDQVAEYVYEKYGREHVAAVGTYHTYRARGAIRDLGKAMGFPPDEIDRIARAMPYYFSDDIGAMLEAVPELRDSGLPFRRYEKLFSLGGQIAGFPRHMGTHLGGLVISRRPLTEVTPLQPSAKGAVITQFDKRGVEDLGLVKLDLLPLRTFGAVEDARKAIVRRRPDFDYDAIPLDDVETFAMLNRGETVGVFQLESPAQRALQPRLQAENLEDIVASVAIIRPGPIQGNMVEPFLARRRGDEPVTYLHPSLEPILSKTWGVVLFQEQVIEIATAVAGFTPGEADRLRRVMSHARSHGEMESIGKLFVDRARKRGVSEELAATIFSYIQGYASYGFCEAHAAAFGTTAYKTAYLLRHFPAEFFAALLSHQPMGYYPPNTLAVEARRRGVPLMPICINESERHFTVEDGAIRIGLNQVKGMKGDLAEAIVAERRRGGPFRSFDDFYRRIGSTGSGDRRLFTRIILCGAFDGLEPHRRRLLWRLHRLRRIHRRHGSGTWSAAAADAAGAAEASGAGASGAADAVGAAEAAGAGASGAADAVQAADSPASRLRDGGIPGLNAAGPGGAGVYGPGGDGSLHGGGGEPLHRGAGADGDPDTDGIDDFTDIEKHRHEFDILRLDVHRQHLMSYFRDSLAARGYIDSRGIRRAAHGTPVKVAGVAVRPHRPPTRSGRTIVFLSLEDEHGLIEVTVFENVYQRHGPLLFGGPVPPLAVYGRVERRDGSRGAPSVVARRLVPLPPVIEFGSGPGAGGEQP